MIQPLTERGTSHIDLHLFYNGPCTVDIAIAAGVDAVIVDCEDLGKRERQHGYDTEINRWQPRDCEQIRGRAPALRVICRIDSFREAGLAAIDQAREAVAAGANEILLPMVERIDEVHAVLEAVAGRAEVGVMIETEGAIAALAELNLLPLRRAFVGLNDLMIERRSRHLFEHILDGTVERVRALFPRHSFGFGGMTLPESGQPVPCRLMIGELARLRCDFTFLRRSFYRDLAATGLDPAEAAMRMRVAWAAAVNRPADAVAADHVELQAILKRIVPDT